MAAPGSGLKNGFMAGGRVLSSRFWRHAFVVFLGVLCFLVLAGCSDGGGESTQEDFCNDLSSLDERADDLIDAVGTLDRAAIGDAVESLREGVVALVESARDVGASNGDEIEAAFDDLTSSINALGEGGGISASLSAISTSLTAFVSTIFEAISQYDCD